ncbi:UNVERIFIED_CONTAM: hypothetical protein RMT77_005977 [Armadillidium vulgare]
MPSNSYNINSSPSLPKKKKSQEEKEESVAHSSKNLENEILENGKLIDGEIENENTLEGKLENIDEENSSHSSNQDAKAAKKRIAMGTITLNGISKTDENKWKENYVPTVTNGNLTTSFKPNFKTESKSSREENNENMARKVTEIFQEVFKEERGNWTLRLEYYMSCLGAPIAFSSLWRFPQLMAQYGGGAFLFAYLLIMILVGIPVYFMETSLAQFSQLSAVHVWRCIPVMQGVGVAMVVLSIIAAVYNSQVVAYAVHYFFASFVNMDKTVLWGECKFFWPKCYDVKSNDICSFLNVTSEVPLHPRKCYEYMISSSRYYWQEQVLRLQELSDVGRIGKIHWDLTLCVAFIWLATFIFLAKGIKSSGKISLFTGFVPICILVTIMVYSVLEDGAYTGIKQFYQPDWKVLAKSEVWQKAAEQAIFSLCITYGSILTFSSYKRFRTEMQVGSILLVIGNIVLTLVGATMVFALFGAFSMSIGVRNARSLMKTEVSGIEIVYVFIPDVIARLFPYPHVWSAFFFFMLLSFGLHSQFSLIETVLTSVYDALPKLRRRKYLAALSLILPLFLLSIPLFSSTGLYIHNIIGSAIIGPNVLLITLIEIVSLQCFYGVRRFSRDLNFILEREPSMYWKVCWIFVAPVTILVLLIFTAIDWEDLIYEDRRENKYWTLYLSWVLTLIPLVMIPFTFIFMLFYKLCVKEPVFQPSSSWGPGCPAIREMIVERRRKRLVESESKRKLDGNENEAFASNAE